MMNPRWTENRIVGIVALSAYFGVGMRCSGTTATPPEDKPIATQG